MRLLASVVVTVAVVAHVASSQRHHHIQISTVASTPPPVAIDASLLTAVTIDVCALKQGLNFSSSPKFQTLASNLAPSVLRIGGSDQNNYHFNVSSQEPVETCGCYRSCSMTPAYWDSIRAFATKTNLRVIFGLSTATVENAQEFIAYTAKDKPFADAGGLLALSWGNELTGGQVGRSVACSASWLLFSSCSSCSSYYYCSHNCSSVTFYSSVSYTHLTLPTNREV